MDRFYNSLKIVFILPKYSTTGSGTFQIEMTSLIQKDSKTSFNYLGWRGGGHKGLRMRSRQALKRLWTQLRANEWTLGGQEWTEVKYRLARSILIHDKCKDQRCPFKNIKLLSRKAQIQTQNK